jgi:hypothetical protein
MGLDAPLQSRKTPDPPRAAGGRYGPVRSFRISRSTTTSPLHASGPTLSATAVSESIVSAPLLPLVEVIELKWLLAGQGVHVHVERLQREPGYADATLAAAESSAEPALRAVAARLRRQLPPT